MLDNFLKIISQVKRTMFTCTYVLSIGVLRTRGLRLRFALHVKTITFEWEKIRPNEVNQFPLQYHVSIYTNSNEHNFIKLCFFDVFMHFEL